MAVVAVEAVEYLLDVSDTPCVYYDSVSPSVCEYESSILYGYGCAPEGSFMSDMTVECSLVEVVSGYTDVCTADVVYSSVDKIHGDEADLLESILCECCCSECVKSVACEHCCCTSESHVREEVEDDDGKQ